ncbi:MAG: XdhC family protein [Woeseiaceae bacterium]
MNLFEFFEMRSSRGESMVLATVYDTAGSTYSKAGGQMLIDSAGNFCGMLSGGCLEGDLVERSRRVIQTGEAETANYDLAADDELWGLGVGCDGTLRVLLQPVTQEYDYQPFAAIVSHVEQGETANLAIVISAETLTIKVGASMLLQKDGSQRFGIGGTVAEAIEYRFAERATTSSVELETANGNCIVLFTPISPAPALLVLGAGLDSEPVVRIARELGWRCTVCDHRPAYIEGRDFPRGCTVHCCAADGVEGRVVLDEFDFAVVMSHHLVSDRSYLRQLAMTGIGYIGLLGPKGRRDRLVSELAEVGNSLQGRLHGPAGIDIGGRGPGPIALSIIAEMQQYLSQRG